MRWILACRGGHLSDVPWEAWAHFQATQEKQQRCRSRALKYEQRQGDFAGLESLQVRCMTCSAKQSLQAIFTEDRLAALGVSCQGRNPWDFRASRCDEPPVVYQRGATALWFPQLYSALDIPPESSYESYADRTLDITSDPLFAVLISAPGGSLAEPLIAQLADKFEVSDEEVRAIIDDEMKQREGAPSAGRAGLPPEDLETAEWLAFKADHAEADPRDRFVTKRVGIKGGVSDQIRDAFAARFDDVVIVTRLREVRALVAFRRVDPTAKQVPVGAGKDIDWLPAIEVFGEGIFVALDEDSVASWEGRREVVKRARGLEEARAGSFLQHAIPEITPRFLLVHTLAHLLIRRLAFESGYSASSLRERLYVRSGLQPQAGFLIYTAAGDTEGTMGGLVRQGEPPRLLNVVLAALESGAWCSADPICAESTGQGFAGMNLAACHACTLLPETSCAHSNAGLDRTSVVGSMIHPYGFLADELAALLSTGPAT